MTVYVVIGTYKGVVDYVSAFQRESAARVAMRDLAQVYGLVLDVHGHAVNDSDNTIHLYEMEALA